MDINKRLTELSLPDPLVMNDGRRALTRDDILLRREEIKELLSREVYGKIPSPPDHLCVKISDVDNSFAAGKATLYTLSFNVSFGEVESSFSVKSILPSRPGKSPAIIYLSENGSIPDKFLPAEEISDRGYAIFVLPYSEIAPYGKARRFQDSPAKHLAKRQKNATAPGKLAMWAWGAMRVMDYLVSQTNVDKERIAVCGHGTLGIAALIAGGYDERFRYVIANCAGTLGTAISREKLGETPENLVESHPELFSKRFAKNRIPFNKRSYDQNFLLFLSLDRHLLIGSAQSDTRGVAEGEFLSVASLKEAISIMNGGISLQKITMPSVDRFATYGRVCYHVRRGVEYFSREDWNTYLDYIDKNP